jgi:hypothetical protein
MEPEWYDTCVRLKKELREVKGQIEDIRKKKNGCFPRGLHNGVLDIDPNFYSPPEGHPELP